MSNSAQLVQNARTAFNSNKTKPIEFRLKQLKALLRLYEENTDAMIQVLAHDLNKSKQESIVMEIDYLVNDLQNTIANLRSWAAPERPPKGFVNLLDALYIHNDPYGVVLVMGSWNYPLQLTLLPAAGAIAAGNCVIIKPSEVSSATSKFIAETIPKYLDNDCYKVFEGGIPETTELLKERFDYIFYTGATHVGRIVHTAANKFLTPVTLELGGKSPVFVDKTVDIKVAAKRIMWGKCVNAGQTCVAPDYLMCTQEVREQFIKAAVEALEGFYGENPRDSPDYPRVISQRQMERLIGVLRGSRVAHGGRFDVSERYMEPTILIDAKATDLSMQEEIFGPILPIVTIEDAADALKIINSREKPLVFYIFSNDRKVVDLLIENTSSGGVLVNDTLMHMATDMPIGGVGASGMGMYHAKYTFDTFTHKKSCLVKDLGVLGESLGAARYPPYTNGKLQFLRFMLKRRQGLPLGCLKMVLVFGLGVATSYFAKNWGGFGEAKKVF